MLTNLENLVKKIKNEPWAQDASLGSDFWFHLMQWLEQNVMCNFLGQVIEKVDEIVDIDPVLNEPQILGNATRLMVEFLGAHSGSVRIYDPQTEQMLSYGSYPLKEDDRERYIPLERSIAGEVVKTRRPSLVSDIANEDLYLDKEFVYRKGVRSLMAIPIEIPRFFPRERDTVGVIQLYYKSRGRIFTPLEVQVANLMAKRLSAVIARKKIFSMQRVNEKKEAIVGHIFRTLGTRGGIKLKDVFNRVIPELADVVNVQSCSLFSITEDLKNVVLEAGYPEAGGYHSIGKVFPASDLPSFKLFLNLRDYSGQSPYEIVAPSYLLVVDPQRSDLLSSNLKRFALLHSINSILYVPLNVNGQIRHIMVFDALEQRQRYRDDEIDIFLFLGRELIKAQNMERLDDALHDFKNPAIATAGFARRLKKLLEQEDYVESKEQIRKYADILVEETSRIQDLSMSMYKVGEKQLVNMTEVLKRRFEINKEAISEQDKEDILSKEGAFQDDLNVWCHLIHLERVFDNLLSNATKAVPAGGGKIVIRTYVQGEWACSEISNTGHISEEDRLKILEGEGQGRGLYITHRIMRLLHGEIDILSKKFTTTFVVRLPLYSSAS